MTSRPARLGLLGFAALLAVYFGLLTLVSGWEGAKGQFAAYWYFVVALAGGFGLQVGLFAALRSLVQQPTGGKVVAASGTTSTVAMASCCAHYLVNVAPVVGATGLVALVAQYQVEIFWLGLALNGAGIAFIATRLLEARREHGACAVP